MKTKIMRTILTHFSFNKNIIFKKYLERPYVLQMLDSK